MADALTCQDCGRSFTPPDALLERFPGWQPKRCRACHAAHSGGRGGSGRASGANGRAADGRASARGGGAEGQRTLAQVLDDFDGGPDSGVFTDGAASPNPGPGGWGAVYVIDGEVVATDRGHEDHTTNNRMELVALLKGIELVPQGTPATVYSDSNLAVRTVTEWAAGWKKRGWKRRTGPVENLDLVQPLYERLQQRPELRVAWIKAHAGNRWNEYADALATAYAREEL